ncbi:DMT family transporter [Roseococcus sp. DSY-14]|uniref:DMT family transporter n=1 Tax=Roseococcus sp. DSY-14 TaxID=3369650 RepID=UPI00387AD20D
MGGTISPRAAGIACMLAGVACFALNDALGKWLVGGFAIGQILLVRSVAGMALLAPAAWRAPGAFRRAPAGRMAGRAALHAGESALFFLALSFLPLAEVVTIYMAAPIWVTALSPWLLREAVGWRRGLAVLAGFAGVVLAAWPGGGALGWGSLVAVAGSFTYALFVIATRRLAGTPVVALLGWQVAATALLGLGLVLAQGWRPAGLLELLPVALLGLGSLLGNGFVNKALALAPAAAVVPWQYTGILWGVALGWLVFADVPGPRTLAGAAVIVAAGLYILARERARQP